MELGHNIHGLCLDGNGLWVGTFSGGLNYIDLRTKTLKHYGKDDAVNTLSSDNIFSICKTSTNDIWIGTTSGLLRYNRSSDDFLRIKELDNVLFMIFLKIVTGNCGWQLIRMESFVMICLKIVGNIISGFPRIAHLCLIIR